jgi:hypothetical protein
MNQGDRNKRRESYCVRNREEMLGNIQRWIILGFSTLEGRI